MNDITVDAPDGAEWLQNKAMLTWNIYRWTSITLDLVTIPICFVSLCIVICCRKRNDAVLISIPILFMTSSTFELL